MRRRQACDRRRRAAAVPRRLAGGRGALPGVLAPSQHAVLEEVAEEVVRHAKESSRAWSRQTMGGKRQSLLTLTHRPHILSIMSYDCESPPLLLLVATRSAAMPPERSPAARRRGASHAPSTPGRQASSPEAIRPYAAPGAAVRRDLRRGGAEHKSPGLAAAARGSRSAAVGEERGWPLRVGQGDEREELPSAKRTAVVGCFGPASAAVPLSTRLAPRV